MLDDAFEDLDEHLIEEQSLDRVDDVEQANRMIRAIARRRRAQADAEMIAEAEIDKIRTWLDAERQRHSTAGLEELLRGYHAARLADDPKLKTLRFPAGELVARAGQAKWDVVDEDAFLGWAARLHPELVRVSTSVDKRAMKATLQAADGTAVDPDSGEVAPGVTVAPGETSFAVKVNTGEAAF